MTDAQQRERIKKQFGIIGSSPLMDHAVDRMIQVAPTDLSVLITGESGVGKEVFARAIHGLSRRKHQRLVSINCGAIPENLLESELFGHEKGAFTGAVEQRKGFFETADKGSIFLDEIGEMPLGTQVKLLRVLETGDFSRLGSSDSIHVDARVIAATNRKLEQEIVDGNFRQDLYFRLNAVQIHLPPLRERPGDIPALVDHFGRELSAKRGSEYPGLSEDAMRVLTSLPWPGNIRELRNMIITVMTLNSDRLITPAMLMPYVPRVLKAPEPEAVPPSEQRDSIVPSGKSVDQVERELIYKTVLQLREDVAELKRIVLQARPPERKQLRELPPVYETIEHTETIDEESDTEPVFNLAEVEKEVIRRALLHFRGNRRKVARELGISPRTLYRKLELYNLD